MAKKSKKERKAAKRKQRIKDQKHQRRSQGKDWPYGLAFEPSDEYLFGLDPYADDELGPIGVNDTSGDLGYDDPFAKGAGMGSGRSRLSYPDESDEPIEYAPVDLDDLLDLDNMDEWNFESVQKERRIMYTICDCFHSRLTWMIKAPINPYQCSSLCFTGAMA